MYDYDEYKERFRSQKTYPEKKLNNRLKTIVEAIPANSRVLDVACGTGRVLYEVIRTKNCTGRGIEISAPACEAAKAKGLDVIEGDVDSFGENPEVEELLFSRYDTVVLSKCIQYFKYKNEIFDRLDTDSVIIFQNNPNYWRSRLNGTRKALLQADKTLPYRLKGGEPPPTVMANRKSTMGASIAIR